MLITGLLPIFVLMNTETLSAFSRFAGMNTMMAVFYHTDLSFIVTKVIDCSATVTFGTVKLDLGCTMHTPSSPS